MFGTRDSRSWPSASNSLRQNLAKVEQAHAPACRLIVVGGHTRSIGKMQLVCDLVAALPEANFIAGKITQYGHGVCAQNGEHCGCAPDEHASAFSWEESAISGTDSARFPAARNRALSVPLIALSSQLNALACSSGAQPQCSPFCAQTPCPYCVIFPAMKFASGKAATRSHTSCILPMLRVWPPTTISRQAGACACSTFAKFCL